MRRLTILFADLVDSTVLLRVSGLAPPGAVVVSESVAPLIDNGSVRSSG
jgi:class 3 adenylate cyclase